MIAPTGAAAAPSPSERPPLPPAPGPQPAPIALARTSLRLLPLQVGLRAGEAMLPVLLASWFGRSAATDALYVLWALFALGGSLVFGLWRDSALVPVLVGLRMHDPRRTDEVTGAVLGHTLAVGGGLAALLGGGALLWLCAGSTQAAPGMAAVLVLPFTVYVVALGARSFFEAVLQAEGRFYSAPLGGAAGMLVALSLMGLGKASLGVAIVPCALCAGELVALAVLATYTLAVARVRPRLSLRRPATVVELGRRAAAEAAGSALTRVNPLVHQALATLTGAVGGGTLLRFSSDVAGAVTSVLQATLLPVLLARLSLDFARGAVDQHRRTVVRAALVTAGLLLGASLLVGLFRRPILSLAFQHGAMDGAAVAQLAELLPYHLVGVAPFGVLLVLARAHTSAGNSRIMLPVGLFNCACNLVLNALLLPVLGLRGLALSTSCVSALVALVFALRLRRCYALAPAPAAPAQVPS